MIPSIEMLEESIHAWAQERGIMAESTPLAQWGKSFEELGELFTALRREDRPAIVDAIGDVMVTLIIQAHMQGLDVKMCLYAAWQEIKERRGAMIGGVFVKEK